MSQKIEQCLKKGAALASGLPEEAAGLFEIVDGIPEFRPPNNWPYQLNLKERIADHQEEAELANHDKSPGHY